MPDKVAHKTASVYQNNVYGIFSQTTKILAFAMLTKLNEAAKIGQLLCLQLYTA